MKHTVVLTLKILQLLGEGYQLKFERSKKGRKAVHAECDRIWHSIDRKQLYYVLDRLKLHKVIKVIKEGDNFEKITITNTARSHTLKQQFKAMNIKHSRRWDKKWRIVLFDVPERFRRKRDALREKLKLLGFLEFQKSTFVYPFACQDEVNFVINFLNISEHVYYIEAPVNPDSKLRKHFKL
ncbi:MAG: hypothetical protein HYT27_02445 [Parcubacteria group bacterium]|nr:hypothetical protein [Parcubacteria group bacterium]